MLFQMLLQAPMEQNVNQLRFYSGEDMAQSALQVSCPLTSSLESIFQALPAAAGHEYLPVGR